MIWLLKKQTPKDLAANILGRLTDKEKWAMRQALANESGSHYYGNGGTIHNSQVLNVETHHGTVCSVWFRCLPIAFTQHEVTGDRATEMERMYELPEKAQGEAGAKLSGVEYAN